MIAEPENFTPDEFREWWSKMSPRLVTLADLFRFRLGQPVVISPVAGAIGRNGPGTSQHYWEQFGEVRALDVFPGRIRTQEDARRAIQIAKECGFTGIGFYPHWSPRPGMHIDVRDHEQMGDPATWGGVKTATGQKYVSIEEAIRQLPAT